MSFPVPSASADEPDACFDFSARSVRESALSCPWWVYAAFGSILGVACTIAVVLVYCKCLRRRTFPFRDREHFERSPSETSLNPTEHQEEALKMSPHIISPYATPRTAYTNSSSTGVSDSATA